MPKLAAFPKAYLDDLCLPDRTMSLVEWIRLASPLNLDGLEMYSNIRDLQDRERWPEARQAIEQAGLQMPMMCCSPDFTHPDPVFRNQQIELEKYWIEMTAALGGTYCRVLSGQYRPSLSRSDGLRYAAEAIEACIPFAAARGITLILENHYKDNYWNYPEFAQKSDVFCDLVDRIHSPHFGVNFDPSNAILAGEDPLKLLRRIKQRVVTMHASDRYLSDGTIEDLRREEGSMGYATRLRHGEIGKGINDYDAIFAELSSVGFDGWISIEDGVDGLEQLQRSVSFLRHKICQFWPVATGGNGVSPHSL